LVELARARAQQEDDAPVLRGHAEEVEREAPVVEALVLEAERRVAVLVEARLEHLGGEQLADALVQEVDGVGGLAAEQIDGALLGLRARDGDQLDVADVGPLAADAAGDDDALAAVGEQCLRVERQVLREMAASMGKVTAAAVGAERLNNTAGSLDQLNGSLDTLKITLGRELLPVIVPVIDTAVKVVNGLVEGFSALPGPVKTGIVVFAGVAAAAGLLLAVVGPIALGVGAIAGAFGVAIGPILLVVGAIAALAAAIAGVIALLPKFKVPAIPGVGGLPGRAAGGPVSGGSAYIVGEKGPELFVRGRAHPRLAQPIPAADRPLRAPG
jgi:hypothetical protein